MPTESVFRRSWTAMTGAARFTATEYSIRQRVSEYSLARRVAAILLGIALPAVARTKRTRTEASATKTHKVTFRHPTPLALFADEDVDEYDYFFKLVKSYVSAGAPHRIQSRFYALASLRELDRILRLAAAESCFRRLEITLFDITFTPRVSYKNLRKDFSVTWARASSCRQYFATVHQRELRETVAQVYGFTVEHLDRSSQPDQAEHANPLALYMRFVKNLWFEETPNASAGSQASPPPVDIDPHIYNRGAATELIRRIESQPSSPPEKKLEDARDALAVASHDFVGADLRAANLNDVPLDGIRWSQRTTRWPRAWISKLLSWSVEVEPGILQIDAHPPGRQ